MTKEDVQKPEVLKIGDVCFRVPFRELLPKLPDEEFERLKADIKANGMLVPPVVDEEMSVIDGHHRLDN